MPAKPNLDSLPNTTPTSDSSEPIKAPPPPSEPSPATGSHSSTEDVANDPATDAPPADESVADGGQGDKGTPQPDATDVPSSPPSVAHTKPNFMSLFKELAKHKIVDDLVKHLVAHPEILDFIIERRGMLPVFGDRQGPSTIVRKGQLRTWDDYTDVVFTKIDGKWHHTKVSR